jgi:indole-3-glycerol phosphate synthase
MNDFLKDIIAHKRDINESKRDFFVGMRSRFNATQYTRYSLFKKQISQPGKINLIAEIKKASPSKGLIRQDFDVTSIARTYVDHHAAAISVLTEDKFFLGKPAYAKEVSNNFKVPVLIKDFFIDEGQIYEARFLGASAILLIVAILKDEEIKHFIDTADRLDLDCLVEVHDEAELNRALDCGAEIIGINNRNLKTFEVNIEVSEKLIPIIPQGKVIVAESGISKNSEVKHLKKLGANAVLIGETFMKEQDIGAKVKEVMGK